jgi:hypothetical protein
VKVSGKDYSNRSPLVPLKFKRQTPMPKNATAPPNGGVNVVQAPGPSRGTARKARVFLRFSFQLASTREYALLGGC